MRAMTDSMCDFDLKTVCAAWTRDGYDEAAALVRWNQEASHFGAMAPPALSSSLCLQMLQEAGILEAGGTGLDVGCGGGQYSFALEQFGYCMHGTDFSPNMIAEAEKRRAALGSRCSFSVDNWHSLDLKEKGWEERFDLVLAHMTPAIADADCFLKLIRASRGAVFLQKPTRCFSALQQQIHGLLGAAPPQSNLDGSFAQAFSIAWLLGCSPRTGYRDTTWTAEMEIDQAVAFYRSRMERYFTMEPQHEQQLRTFLMERFPEGTVTDVTHVHLAAVLFLFPPRIL